MDTPVPQTLASNLNGYGEMQLSKQSFCAVLTSSTTADLVPTASMILRIMQQLQGWVLNDCVLPVCSLTRPTVPCPFARCNETLEHGNAHTSSKSHKRTRKQDTSHRTDKRKPTQKPLISTCMPKARITTHPSVHMLVLLTLADQGSPRVCQGRESQRILPCICSRSLTKEHCDSSSYTYKHTYVVKAVAALH